MKRNIISLQTVTLLAVLSVVISCKKDKSTDPVTDASGNVYRTVAIGSQIWMAENLKTTRYRDSTVIRLVSGNSTWISTTSAAYCWYNNDTVNKPKYGAIYNWYAVATGKLCPAGWHVPTHDEFKTLEIELGMVKSLADSMFWRGTDQGTKMKSREGWDDGGNGTNSSGFSALPGGYRWGVTGEFFNLGSLSYWWTATEKNATEGLYRRLDGNEVRVYAEGVRKQAGKYVRCVKDPV